VALGIGLLANEIVGRVAKRHEAGRIRVQVEGLLAVVEPSASAACFVGDHRLAQETAQGLLNSPSIAVVEIRTTEGVLARAQRDGGRPTELEVVRPVPSPFRKDQSVGEIRVLPDAEETARSVARYVWALRGLVLLMAAVLGAALAVTVMYTVVRPIKLISDRLDGLDAYHGLRLEFPPGHAKDEIGRLVVDVNRALEAVEQQHRLEQQVKDAHALKINSLGSLAGGVAHDFNNMLAGIMAYADLLLTEEEDPRRQKFLRSILGAATRSSELTAKLLAFGRRGKNRVETVDLKAAVQECLTILKPTMPPDLQVTRSLEDDLRVDGDPAQIQQVLMNLCINAIEAMPGVGVLGITSRQVVLDEGEASAHRLPPGGYVLLEVSDTGPGISKEVLTQIFEPFFTTKTKTGEMGTGLGLSTVYGIVEAHHGVIEVASEVGVGTRFQVLLPVGQLRTEAPIPERTLGIGKGTILVVEDEQILREVAQNALESLGYEVATAENGRQAVECYRAMHGHLVAVLLDLKMPVLGGREAFLQMQAIDASVPVIICTGYGENEEVQEILSRGAARLLSKPYRILDLSEALQRLEVRS
jgi:signal transduction histidine kinase